MTAFQNPAGDPGGSTPGAPSRFSAIETFYDPESVRLLYARGIDEGWRCLEVGAGSGSLIKWMCSRVGNYGRVVATDLDIEELQGLDEPNLEVHKHDVVSDPLPERVFHLVHARLVLGEIAERDAVLERLAESVRSDGFIVIEDLDRGTMAADSDDPQVVELFDRLHRGINAAMRARGLDPDYGRRVYRKLRALEMVGAIAHGGSTVQEGGSPSAALVTQEINNLREAMIASGEISAADIDAGLALLQDPTFAFLSPTMVTTWARRPSPF